jgi:hypothetical protein
MGHSITFPANFETYVSATSIILPHHKIDNFKFLNNFIKKENIKIKGKKKKKEKKSHRLQPQWIANGGLFSILLILLFILRFYFLTKLLI